jgi:hypothetical protein
LGLTDSGSWNVQVVTRTQRLRVDFRLPVCVVNAVTIAGKRGPISI